MKKRILVASDLNAKDRAHFTLVHEFCRIIAECDDADVIAPGLHNYIEKYLNVLLSSYDRTNIQRDFNRLLNGVRKGLGLRNWPTIEPVTIEQNYDLFYFMGWDPQSLVELSRIRNWRSRCKVAVAYIIELWSSEIDLNRKYLRLLDQFDHVFLLHSAGLPRLPLYTTAPCSFLPTGVDCLMATPYPFAPRRVIDVYSIGNRVSRLHNQLLASAERRELFYLYDSLSSSNSEVKDWHEHRLLFTNIVKRSRYFMGFNPASVATSSNASKIANEQVLPGRLFEGAAGGAIILGTAPQCREFRECFDWPDAVIEVNPESSDITAVIKNLDAQPERLNRARQTNAIRCLLQHDWAYRWEHILSTVGMTPRPHLFERKAWLRDIALRASANAGGELKIATSMGQAAALQRALL